MHTVPILIDMGIKTLTCTMKTSRLSELTTLPIQVTQPLSCGFLLLTVHYVVLHYQLVMML